MAGRALGELVRKLGERVLPSIIPILSRGVKDPSASRRQVRLSAAKRIDFSYLVHLVYHHSIYLQGVCIGLSEVMASAGKHQLLHFMDELIPTIRTALCDRSVSFSQIELLLFLVKLNLTNDSSQEVRESAGLAFSTLYKVLLFNSVLLLSY